MTRKRISILVMILILSTFAATFMPLVPAQAQPTGWRALTGMLPPYTTIDDATISPNSQYVVFTADIDVDDQYNLYSVPITGSVPVKLNPPLVAGGDVIYFSITPDSSRVIYIADQDVDERIELYNVPIAGGPALKLNGPLVSGGNVGIKFSIAADTGRVVYTADQQSNDVIELYSVPLGGGAFVKLNPPLASGGDLSPFGFEIDPVSDRVVYSADQDTDTLVELYSVPITGGLSVKLNLPVSQSISTFEITPGSAYVMYLAKAVGSSAYQLYGNNTTGGTVQKRNLDLDPGQNVLSFRISPNGSQVVYDVAANNRYVPGNLYRTSPFAGASQILTVADPEFGVDQYDFVFTPDGERIVCLYQLNAAAPLKLISVKTTGFPVSRADLFEPDAGHNIGVYRVSPDSQWVVFSDYPSSGLDSVLRAVPTAGGSPLVFGPGADQLITPDSQRVIYRSPPDGDHSDLISIQIFGGSLRNLSRMRNTDYAYAAQISPDGQWIVFQVQLIGNSGTIGYQLRVSDGAEAPLVFYNYLPLVQK
jgi:Tol biopolymer transport system component